MLRFLLDGMDKGSKLEFIIEDDVINEISIVKEDLPDADVESEDVQRRFRPVVSSSLRKQDIRDDGYQDSYILNLLYCYMHSTLHMTVSAKAAPV